MRAPSIILRRASTTFAAVIALLTTLVLLAAPVHAASPTPSPTPTSTKGPSATDIAKAKAKAAKTKKKLTETNKALTSMKSQLQTINTKAEVAVEKWQATQAQAAQAQVQLTGAQAVAARAQTKLDGYRDQLNAYAVAAYMDGGPVADLAALLNASNPEDILTRSVTLQAVGREQTRVVSGFAAASESAAWAKSVAAQASTNAQQLLMQAAGAKAEAAAAVALAQQVVAKLQAAKAGLTTTAKDDKKRVALLIAQREAALAAARAAAARAQAEHLRALAAVNGFPPATADQGKLALEWAKTQLGVPYSWGGGDANGPTLGFVESKAITSGASTIGFDCSGLALYAWAHVGYTLGHYTGAQWVEGTAVPNDKLRPGDLLFFATDVNDPLTIHHVGIYAGHGQMIDAPETGSFVRYDAAFRPGYIGAVRP